MALAESREEFYARIGREAPRITRFASYAAAAKALRAREAGAPVKAAPKRARSASADARVQTLTERVAFLEAALAVSIEVRDGLVAALAEACTVPPSREVIDEARVRELEAEVRGFKRWGVAG